jgi:transcriptional regulator with XRE-family HTH domain
MGKQYPKLGQLQPKNLCKTIYPHFGRLEPMNEVDPRKYGSRVRECREALGLSQAKLGKLCGYSQSNIDWIEKGRPKRPQSSVTALSAALHTSPEYLLWGTGPKQVGPVIMSAAELQQNYNALPPEDRAAITALIAERIEAAKEKRKIG